jgi:hypothetical protein
VARLLDEHARPREPVIYFGAGFTPFELGDALRAYYERPHCGSGARRPSRALWQAPCKPPGVGGAASSSSPQDRHLVPPPVAGWVKAEQRVFSGNPPLLVAVYEWRR